MAKNKSDLKSKVLDSLDIPDFYRQHLVDFGATNNKGYATALCPFHDDHNPSLSINLETGYFHCFACGQKGSVFDFYARQHGHGMDFRTSLTDLARITGNFEEDNTKAQEGHIKIVRAYNYTDEKGKLLFQIVRSKNKVFRARKPQGKGNWEWGVEGIDLVPFNLPAVYGAKTVYIAEGEKDAQNLEKLGLTATCNPFGALKWRSEFKKHFNNKRIVILPDNDETGRKHAQQVAKSLGASSRSTKIVDLPGLSPKGDVSDWIKAGGTKRQLLALVKETEEWRVEWKQDSFTASELIKTPFPAPRWAIRGLLPEGLNILGGKPKHGKSILGLNWCLEISLGGNALGQIDVEEGSTIYLALEDPPRRVKYRLIDMLKDRDAPSNLHIFTKWKQMDEGGLEDLEQVIRQFPDLRLVVIDTLAKFRPVRNGSRSNLYNTDYQDISAIKDLADKHNISIMLIHHLRKMGAEDVMDTFSGTLGLTGAADGLLALVRNTGQMDAELFVTGRDIESNEYALSFESESKTWDLLGKVRDVKATIEKQKLFDALREANEPLSPSGLSEITGLKVKYVKNTLPKLIKEGDVRKVTYGKYEYCTDPDDSEDSPDNEHEKKTRKSPQSPRSLHIF